MAENICASLQARGIKEGMLIKWRREHDVCTSGGRRKKGDK